MGDGRVHSRRHPLLVDAQDGLIRVADQIEGGARPPCRLAQRSAERGAVDRPLGCEQHRLLGRIDILREQRRDAGLRQFDETFRIGAHLAAERRGLELSEQRAGRLTGIGCEGVDIDEPRYLRIIARLADHGAGIAVADQHDVALGDRDGAAHRRHVGLEADQRELDGSHRHALRREHRDHFGPARTIGPCAMNQNHVGNRRHRLSPERWVGGGCRQACQCDPRMTEQKLPRWKCGSLSAITSALTLPKVVSGLCLMPS